MRSRKFKRLGRRNNLRILSFDISTSPGVAVIDIKDGKPRLEAVDHVETGADMTDSQRYKYVEAFVTQFVHENGPFDVIVREKFIKGGSKRGTQLVFGAWASVDRALAIYGYAIEEKDEIVASTAKRIVAGNGRASKEEVADGVVRMLGDEVKELLYTPRGR